MSTSQEALRDRTKAFAVRVVRLYRSLPQATDAQVLGETVTSLRYCSCRKLPCGLSLSIARWVDCEDRSGGGRSGRAYLLARDAFRLRDCKSDRLQDMLSEAHELCAIFTSTTHGQSGTIVF